VDCILTGAAQSGRTSILVALLRLWKCRSVPATTWLPEGSPSRWRLRLPDEEHRLYRLRPPGGFLGVELAAPPLGLSGRRWLFLELPGLLEDPEGQVERKAMAEALGRLVTADVVVHVVDAAHTGEEGSLREVDTALFRLLQAKRKYLVMANKMDQAGAAEGLAIVRQCAQGGEVVASSALVGQGIRQLRTFLASLS